ncbi:MAG: type II toxin-antitoxin system RelE/ParE family toxin [Trueperaceae bacterium]
MIRSFRDRAAERLFHRQRSRRIPDEIQQGAYSKLRMLDGAKTLADLRVAPGNRLEGLKGKRSGQYSIRINRQWRICFVWRDGSSYEVEIVEYH